MNGKFKPLAVEDFGLTSEEMKLIVEGSQRFLGPTPEEEPVDAGIESPTSLEHGNQS